MGFEGGGGGVKFHFVGADGEGWVFTNQYRCADDGANQTGSLPCCPDSTGRGQPFNPSKKRH